MNKKCSKISNKGYFVILRVCKYVSFCLDIVYCLYKKEICYSIWLCVYLLMWTDIIWAVEVSSIFLHMKTERERQLTSQSFADYYPAPNFVRSLSLLSG